MSSTPIADLSYRNYDGPIEPPSRRWWAIAKMSIDLTLKKKGFWIWSALSAWWYVALLFIFYFSDRMAGQFSNNLSGARSDMTPDQLSGLMMQTVKWQDPFIHAFSFGQLLFFVLALLTAVGTIANDNRANALLVYLSKPCTKLDYVIGKWLGIFIPITIVVGFPMLLFYGYCIMSYRQYGFTHDPWLILKILLIIPLPGIVHASVGMAVSSLFKQGWLAGATYAGIYFISLFFTKAMQIVHIVRWDRGRGTTSATVDVLSYFSLDGLQIGTAKSILGSDGGPFFPFATPGMTRQGMFVPAPPLMVVLPITLIFCALCLLLAWSRIKAVEVVS